MKKRILAIGAGVALALTVFAGCGKGGESTALTNPNDVYGMGAVSTVKLLGGTASAQAIRSLSAVKSVAAEPATDASEVKAQAEKFNEYFTALDSFMSEEIVSTLSEPNTDENYPFETKLTIKSKDFNGKNVENVMYFTETLLGTETEENETESLYALEGVMVVDGADYLLTGERSLEQEDDETENELRIRAYADGNDKTSYVEMEQEHSVENNETETEYVYSVYQNGVLVEQTAVEFETEKKGEREEVEYELEFRKGDAKGRYVVERETKNGKTEIKVEYNIDGKQGEFRISENGEKQYEYSFGDDTKLVF